jgi:hypothetical protein
MYEKKIMKSIKNCSIKKGGETIEINEEEEFDQSMFYSCTENPLYINTF